MDSTFAGPVRDRGRSRASTRRSSALLRAADAALAERLARGARAAPAALDRGAESELLIALAPHLEDFLARLFGIEAEVRALRSAASRAGAAVSPCKRQFVQRKAMNKYKADDAASIRRRRAARASSRRCIGAPLDGMRASSRSHAPSRAGSRTKRRTPLSIDLALRYAAWAAHTPAGKARASRRRAVQARRASSITCGWSRSNGEHKHGVDSAAARRATTCGGAKASR